MLAQNQVINIPFPANQTLANPPTISIMRLSDRVLIVSGAAMTAGSLTIWTYEWTTPRVIDDYQVMFNDGSLYYSGPTLTVDGNVIFTVVSDAGNTASTFKTNLTDSVNDKFRAPSLVRWRKGVLADEIRRLANAGSYNGTTMFLTVEAAFTGAPAAGNQGEIIVI